MPEFKSFLRVLCARFLFLCPAPIPSSTNYSSIAFRNSGLDRFPHICGNLLPSVYSRNELQHFYRIRTTSRAFHSATSAPLHVVNEETNRLQVRVHFTQKFDNELEGKSTKSFFSFAVWPRGPKPENLSEPSRFHSGQFSPLAPVIMLFKPEISQAWRRGFITAII